MLVGSEKLLRRASFGSRLHLGSIDEFGVLWKVHHFEDVNEHVTSSPAVAASACVFSLDDLRTYFKRQRHKDFVVVRDVKSPANKNLGESCVRLKKFFVEAGFKRVLITLPHDSGVMVLGDFRVARSDQKKPPAIEFELVGLDDDDIEPVIQMAEPGFRCPLN